MYRRLTRRRELRAISIRGKRGHLDPALLFLSVFLSYIFFFATQASAQSAAMLGADKALVADGSESAVSVDDAGAVLFMQKCMACHTIGGGAYMGPDLKPATGWPRSEIGAAVKRMEVKVGALAADELEALTGLLDSDDPNGRIAAQRERVRMRTAGAGGFGELNTTFLGVLWVLSVLAAIVSFMRLRRAWKRARALGWPRFGT